MLRRPHHEHLNEMRCYCAHRCVGERGYCVFAAILARCNDTAGGFALSCDGAQRHHSFGFDCSQYGIAARRDGYALKIKAKSGTYVFCKTDATVGSRFTKESCVDVDKFVLMQQQKQRDQAYMRTTIQGLQCDLKMGC